METFLSYEWKFFLGFDPLSYVFFLTNGNSVLGPDSSGHNVPPKPYAPPPNSNSGGQNNPSLNPIPSAPNPDFNPNTGNRGNNIYPNLPTNGNNDPYSNRNNGNNDPYPNRGSYDPTPTNNRGKINLFHTKILLNSNANPFFH